MTKQEKDIKIFKNLYKQLTGITLSDKQALKKAQTILELHKTQLDFKSNRCHE